MLGAHRLLKRLAELMPPEEYAALEAAYKQDQARAQQYSHYRTWARRERQALKHLKCCDELDNPELLRQVTERLERAQRWLATHASWNPDGQA